MHIIETCMKDKDHLHFYFAGADLGFIKGGGGANSRY